MASLARYIAHIESRGHLMRQRSGLRSQHGRHARRQRGYTLVETAVVGALTALLAAMAAPSFVEWRARDRVDAGAQALRASLAFARSEAIRRGEPVSICLLDREERCLPARGGRNSGSADWASGWAVVADAPNALTGRAVLRTQPHTDSVVIRGAANEIRFSPPAGQVIGGFRSFDIAPERDTAILGPNDGRRCIAIAAGGRARVAKGACRNGA